MTPEAPITAASDDSLEYLFVVFQRKFSCKSSAGQKIHMKYQALLFLKDKSKEN